MDLARDVLQMAVVAIAAGVLLASLVALLLALRILAAIRAHVSLLAALPDIQPARPGVTQQQVPDGYSQSWLERLLGQHAPEPVHEEPPDGTTEVRMPPPYLADSDQAWAGYPTVGQPAAKSKHREDLGDEP